MEDMYWLMSMDAVIRIAVAMALLFVVIPALAWPRRNTSTWLEWFFWNLGIGIAILTLSGQILALAGLNSPLTILLVAVLIVLFARSAHRGVPIRAFVKQAAERTFLGLLNTFDGRVNVRRRLRRTWRRAITRLREATRSRLTRMQIAGWVALTAIAAGFRLYRPLASANLGFSDTYVHLYVLKLLEDGRQVDPEWGPYPRGMHFLLLAVQQLTNVDEILLLNFFGAFVGVVMVLGVADAARRLSGSLVAGFVAGFLYATLVGGPRQYFVLGGAFSADTASTFRALPYEAIRAGEFDILLTTFHRQTSTLPQELAIALLFPAVLFLRDFLRKGDRWHLLGYAGCTAAIAAVHTGVLFPLAILSALMFGALALERGLAQGTLRRTLIAGAAAVVIGSSWMLAYFMYPYVGGRASAGSLTSLGDSPYLLYYFPFLRSLTGGAATIPDAERIVVTFTPFLIACALLAAALIVVAILKRDELRASRIWIAATCLLFLLFHFASTLGLPELLEMRRNAQWLTMALAIVLGMAIVELGRFLPRAGAAALIVLLLVGWTTRVPRLSNPAIHDRIVNYSGYGASALAVLRIGRSLEPYTWTIVSYGQEFPMVMRRGFHLSAVDFLDGYDPQSDVLPIPTPHVFIIVEKTAHPFQIDTWAQRHSRSDLEQRLQTWVHLYQATHRNMRVFLEDEFVRVYQIERRPEELRTEER